MTVIFKSREQQPYLPNFIAQDGFPNIVRHLSGTLDVAVYSRLCLQGEIASGSGDINLQDKCIQQLSLVFLYSNNLHRWTAGWEDTEG